MLVFVWKYFMSKELVGASPGEIHHSNLGFRFFAFRVGWVSVGSWEWDEMHCLTWPECFYNYDNEALDLQTAGLSYVRCISVSQVRQSGMLIDKPLKYLTREQADPLFSVMGLSWFLLHRYQSVSPSLGLDHHTAQWSDKATHTSFVFDNFENIWYYYLIG